MDSKTVENITALGKGVSDLTTVIQIMQESMKQQQQDLLAIKKHLNACGYAVEGEDV